MPYPDTSLLSRRSLLALSAVLALPGCAVTLPNIRELNLDAIGPDQALLLGHLRLTILGFDRTGDAFIRANTAGEEVLVPPEGEIAWLVTRPRRADVRLVQIASSGTTLALGDGPVLAPSAVRTAINYFGTISISLESGLHNNRSSGRVGQAKVDVTDDRQRAMAAFVAQNPRLAGRTYCHVISGTTMEAPPRG